MAAGLLLSGTAMPAAAAEPSPLPDHIVNGDFEYPSIPIKSWVGFDTAPDVGKEYITINPDTATAGQGCVLDTTGWTINGFDKTRFAWSSTQKRTPAGTGGSGVCEAGNVELNRELHGNVYAEITADVQHTAIYQDIDTASDTDTMYTVRLRHASSNKRNVDSMQVLIGPPGAEKPIPMTRTVSNGHGDRVGETSLIIATMVTNDNNADKQGQWETYQATVIIPAGQPVTRFTFKALSSPTWFSGNDVDDITFAKGYPLTYDGNGNTAGTTPRQTN